MTRVRVYISTTQAPAEIQRIAEEDPEIRSVICLDGKAVELPVSAAYDTFVRKPTGVIEAEFGHPSYRVDVGARITEGLSWQLGIYLAHALDREDRLAAKGEVAEHIVLATGEVDRDLHVRAVDHIADKVRVAAPLFARAAAEGRTVILFVPMANRAELDQPVAGLKVVPVETVHDALAWLGTERLPRAAAASLVEEAVPSVGVSRPAAPAVDRPPARRRRGAAVWGGMALAAAAAGAAWWAVVLGVLDWQDLASAGAYEELDARLTSVEAGDCIPCRWAVAAFDRSRAVVIPDAGGLRFAATALTVPRFRTCRVAEFRPDLLGRAAVPWSVGAGFAESEGSGLCAVEYTMENRGADLQVLLMAAVRIDDAEPTVRLSDPAFRLLASGDSLPLAVEMPARLARPMTVTLFAVAGDVPLEAMGGWLARMIGEAAQDDETGADLRRRLARAGLALVRADHRIAPAPPRFQ